MHAEEYSPTSTDCHSQFVDRCEGNDSVSSDGVKNNDGSLQERMNSTFSSRTPLLQRIELLECNLATAADKYRSNSDSDCSQLWSPRIDGKATEWLLRPVSHALEEAKEKGSLIERVAALERNFFMLSIELKKMLSPGHTFNTKPLSKSPSSRSEDSYKTVPDLPVSEEKHEVSPNQCQQSALPRRDALGRDEETAIQNGRPSAVKQRMGTKSRNERDPESNSEVSFDDGEKISPTILDLPKKKRKKHFRQFLHKLLHPGSYSHAQDTRGGLYEVKL